MPAMAGRIIRTMAVVLVAACTTALAACSDDRQSGVLITPVNEAAAVPATAVQEPTAAQLASPSPIPTETAAPRPAVPRSFFSEHQIVAYYGNPWSPIMGILGEYDNDELIRRLRDQAARYQALNLEKKVLPALHLVYAVAQGDAGRDGSFIAHMPSEIVEEYIELTRRHNMLFFIDLQMGRADPVAEAARVQHWMRHDHVHLAVDPEFTMAPGERPGVDLGSMDGKVVNQIQDLLQATAVEAGIANKILIVHQFQYSMLTNKAAISDRDRVDVVIDLDGWGPPWSKQEKYTALATNEPVEYAGFKLFYRWDKPMMTEEEVLALVPRPAFIVYQ